MKTPVWEGFSCFDKIEEACFLLDPGKGFIHGNKSALSLFSVNSIEEFSKLNPVLLSPEFQYDGAPSKEKAREIQELALQRGSLIFQWIHKRPDGSEFPASITLNRIRTDEGPVLLGFIQKALPHLREPGGGNQDDEYESTINNLPIGVIVHSADSSIILCNPMAEHILGVSKEQLMKRQAMDPEWRFVNEEGNRLSPEEFPVSLVMASRKSLDNRIFGIQRTDRAGYTWILVNAVPLFDAENFIHKIIVNFYDITQMRKIEEELTQSRKMDAIGQLAGGVAHDFNNVLTGIISSVELLKTSVAPGSLEDTYLDIIMQSSQRAADLNAKLLSFSRKGKSVSTPVNVHSIIDDTTAILERSLDKRNRILTRKKAPYHTVTGDDSQLQNALLNLCINAANAMPEGGEILISTENIELEDAFCESSSFDLIPGEYLLIEIQDSGTGIPQKHINRIFEPFFTTKKAGKGTGLGLASVYGTVKQHHGAISVYSEVGVGSSFHIYLPVCSDSTPIRKRVENLIQGTGVILLVDDEEIIRITAEKMLKSMNYEVILARDGREAVDIFRENHRKIDLVLLDMIMPVLNGRETFNMIRQIDPDVKVVLSSGFSKAEDVKQMTEKGLSGFIRKPYRKAELSRIIADILTK